MKVCDSLLLPKRIRATYSGNCTQGKGGDSLGNIPRSAEVQASKEEHLKGGQTKEMVTLLQPWDKLQPGKLWFLLLILLLHISPENVTNQNPEEIVPGWSKLNGRSKWVWAVQGLDRSGCWRLSHYPAAVSVLLLTAHGCILAKDLSLAEQCQLTWELSSLGIRGAIPVEQFMFQSSARGQAKLKPVFTWDHILPGYLLWPIVLLLLPISWEHSLNKSFSEKFQSQALL